MRKVTALRVRHPSPSPNESFRTTMWERRRGAGGEILSLVGRAHVGRRFVGHRIFNGKTATVARAGARQGGGVSRQIIVIIRGALTSHHWQVIIVIVGRDNDCCALASWGRPGVTRDGLAPVDEQEADTEEDEGE